MLLGILALQPAGPRYEFQETTVTPTTANANYYGAGITGYSVVVSGSTVGPFNPSEIFQAEQNHAVSNAYIDFQQRVDSSGWFFSRNAPLSASAQNGSTFHLYGATPNLYTSIATTATASSTQTLNFAIIAPSNSLPMTYRRIRALIPASSEESNFSPDSTTVNYKLRGMSKVWSTEKRLNVNLIFISGSNPAASTTGIAEAITRMTDLYTQNTVRIRPVISSTTIVLPSYLTLTSLSTDTTATGSLGGLMVNTASAQRADALNIIFVKNETAVGGVLGISTGIPGLPGRVGTRQSGMVVMFDGHLASAGAVPSSAEQRLIGETMAHEGGHWLGLFHPVESNYDTTQNNYNRDAISETPLCTAAGVGLAACDFTAVNNAGSRNVMFWAGTAGFDQSDLTGEQGFVLRRHPLAY